MFSAFDLENLGFEVDFRLEENDLGRRFLKADVEDMVFAKEANNVEIDQLNGEREKEGERIQKIDREDDKNTECIV